MLDIQYATPSISQQAFCPINPQLVPTCSKPNVKGAPTNFIVYNALSVQIKIFSLPLRAPTILVPSWSLCEPAVLIAVGVYSFSPSWVENLINISSWVLSSPIVVSVPQWITCLVVGDIKVILDAVGLPKLVPATKAVTKLVVVVEARVVNAVLAPTDVSQVKVLPFKMVAINTCPKLLNDHNPGSRVTEEAEAAIPHPVWAPLLTVPPNWGTPQP